MLTTEIAAVYSSGIPVQFLARPIILEVNVNSYNQLENMLQLPTYCEADTDSSQ